MLIRMAGPSCPVRIAHHEAPYDQEVIGLTAPLSRVEEKLLPFRPNNLVTLDATDRQLNICNRGSVEVLFASSQRQRLVRVFEVFHQFW